MNNTQLDEIIDLLENVVKTLKAMRDNKLPNPVENILKLGLFSAFGKMQILDQLKTFVEENHEFTANTNTDRRDDTTY